MSSPKSKKKSKSSTVKLIKIRSTPPRLVVITVDTIRRLEECNPNKSFGLFLFYISLLFSCGLAYITLPVIGQIKLIIFICVSVIVLMLSLTEFISYKKKKDSFEKILEEIKNNKAEIISD